MLLDLFERLRRNGLTSQMTFNLPLTQEQMADYLGLTLVHVNRTMRRLREQRIAIVDRQVVIIRDLNRLREFAHGGPLSYRSGSCRKTRWRTYQPARKRGWVARERALRPHAVR